MASPLPQLSDNKNIALPPLQPITKTGAKPPKTPVVYTLKLTDALMQKILAASGETQVRFKDANSGHLVIPGADPVKFSTDPITENNPDAQGYCFTQRHDSIRRVGPIIAHMVVEAGVPLVSVPRTTPSEKKRPTSKLPAVPFAKRRKPNDKRSRPAPSIPASVPKPTIPAAVPPPRLSSKPISSLPPPPTQSKLVSAMPPSVSPPENSPKKANGKPGRNPWGLSRTVSPGNKSNSPGKASELPKPVAHTVGTKPVVSPSQMRNSMMSMPQPIPPALDEAAKKHILHFLALGKCNMHSVMARLRSKGVLDANRNSVMSFLKEIGEQELGNMYSLKMALWSKVDEAYAGYTDVEKTKMRMQRSAYDAMNGNGIKGSMSDKQLEEAMDEFQKASHAPVRAVTNEKEESEMRRAFETMFPVYNELISRIEDISNMFDTLAQRYKEKVRSEEKQAVADKIMTNHQKYHARYDRYEKVLKAMHALLKSMQKALEEYIVQP